MSKYEPNWVFNLTLQIAVVVCLGILATALAMNVAPLTALWRSSLAFVTFVLLGRAISLIWQVPEPVEVPVEVETQETDETAPPTENRLS